MDPIALRPRKATEIIDAAVEVYRRNPIHFLLLAALVRVPWLIVQIFYMPRGEPSGEAISTAIMISFGTMLTTFFMAGFIVHMASELYLGHETDAFATIRAVAPRIPAVFIGALLQAVAIFMGLVLFLLPAVWISAVVFAVIPAIVLENRSAFGAFDRSGQLAKGVKAHVLGALGLVVLIRIIVEVGVAILVSVIPIPEIQYVAATAAAMLIYPLLGIATTLLYYDVRIRKEGFDIEMMARQAPDTAPATV
jgi:hypothetical protein